MALDNSQEFLGKKTFFLHPSVLTQGEIIPAVFQQEFEVYIIKDEFRLLKLLRRYPQSVVFASIDEKLQAKEWENLLRQISSNEANKNIVVGVLAAADKDETRRLYIDTLGLKGGYIITKPDAPKAVKQILETLKTANAKGRRKYIRTSIKNDPTATLNIPRDGDYIKGVIKDISAVGFSCSFAEDPRLAKNVLLQDIQLKLQSSLLKVEGIVFGSRTENRETVYVVIFTQKTDPDARTRIRTYVQHSNQTKMEKEG